MGLGRVVAKNSWAALVAALGAASCAEASPYVTHRAPTATESLNTPEFGPVVPPLADVTRPQVDKVSGALTFEIQEACAPLIRPGTAGLAAACDGGLGADPEPLLSLPPTVPDARAVVASSLEETGSTTPGAVNDGPPERASKIPVPEPASVVLLATGLFGLMARRALRRAPA